MGRDAKTAGPEPLCQLIRFEAADGINLSGLLYEPSPRLRGKGGAERRGRGAPVVVWLHGTGGASVFDTGRTNLLAAELTARGLAFFPFNNRGAHLVRRLHKKGRKRSVMGGMGYERIRDCVPDIDGAARVLRRRGHRTLYLAGHSTGANKVAVYDHYKPRNPFRRYILLAGGDDTGLMYDQLGPAGFRRTLATARERIRARRGEELVPKSISDHPMSWTALYDTMNPDGDYNVFPFLEALRGVRLSRRPFRYFRALRKPTLVLYGEDDEYAHGDISRSVAVLSEVAGPNTELAIIKDADHGFSGREADLGELIANWLA
ncbi:MAG TPA: alpha/beta hydrolase [Thermoanaerobaculia bacterium]|nr:alpha/beta hydrolase [Thermoanaerobaculia bacterium]